VEQVALNRHAQKIRRRNLCDLSPRCQAAHDHQRICGHDHSDETETRYRLLAGNL